MKSSTRGRPSRRMRVPPSDITVVCGRVWGGRKVAEVDWANGSIIAGRGELAWMHGS
jgi:hypothetical protein